MLRSIRWTLQLWHAGLLAVVLTAFGTVTYFEIRRSRYAQLDTGLERMVQVVATAVRPPHRPFDGPGNGGRGYGGPGFEGPGDRWRARGPDERDFGPPGDGGGPGPDGFGERPWRAVELSPALQERFAALAGGDDYFLLWDREGTQIARSPTAPEMTMPNVPDPPLFGERPTNDRPDGAAGAPPREIMSEKQPDAAPADPPDGPGDGRNDGRPGFGDGRRGPREPQPPVLRWRDGFREAVMAGPFGVRVVVGRSTAAEEHDLRRLALLMLATGVCVLAIGLAGGLALASRVTRPIRNITAAAKAVTAANLSKRIDVSETESELGQLAAVLNDAFGRLDNAFAQQVRFTADASHELRTPLAVVHSAVQLALSKPERTAESYRKTLETCQRASTRMKELVDSLLLLAGVDAGRLTLERGPVDLSQRVDDTAELLAPLALQKEVTIETDLQPLTLHADGPRLSQVLTNIIGNAVRYNRPGGRVRVSLTREKDAAVITVADTGVGIPAEHQAHLFERFYRVDPARSRAEGGSGLGLAIARGIVAAHGGAVTFVSTAGEGTTFTVRLPIVAA